MVLEEVTIISLEEMPLVHLFLEILQVNIVILQLICQDGFEGFGFRENDLKAVRKIKVRSKQRKRIRDGLTDSLRGLSSTEVHSVVGWRDFYFRSYKFVGRLVGRYYDSQGNPTKYLKGAEAKAARGAQLMEKQKEMEAKQPSCNSRWSQDDGGEVWCDNGFPRLVQRPLEIALTGKMSKRCACYNEDQLGQPGLEVYSGCDYLAKRCRV
ncbi:membrane-associated progesterone-binding protein 4 isoform X4 [Gossypium hirsutum]|uniref:Membrane-associated progesterone-binding protein 4 isoform X4 n=1 Tax=Gossypium hirsutum TaxID=3635 RepID=A0ABM2ZB70_GOSHI|nr:membrane-associated progesterone-binding protein 4 isoform X4 [Gossypium hirsutum]